jgi:hypothetical protein
MWFEQENYSETQKGKFLYFQDFESENLSKNKRITLITVTNFIGIHPIMLFRGAKRRKKSSKI